MGRKPKYATLRTYQPYIDAIRKDLGIPDSYYVKVRFGTFSTKGGYASTHEVVIDKRQSKHWTLEALMHEFEHIRQRWSGDYKQEWIKTKRSKYHVLYINWKGTLYKFHNIASAKAAKNMKLYEDRPWEVAARAYESQVYRLFPGLQVPGTYSRKPMRLHIGTSSKGTKFYKYKGDTGSL